MELFCENTQSRQLRCDWVLDTPLEGFVQDAPREELDIAPVVECLTATAWQNYHRQISSKQYHEHIA